MAGIEAHAFRILQGGESIRRYIKSESTVLAFCGNCGSSLYAEKAEARDAPPAARYAR